jgi:glucose-6-phosphate 1-dehydrogenase
VSYLAMEAPSSTIPEAIRDEQAKVLRTVRPISADNMVRG